MSWTVTGVLEATGGQLQAGPDSACFDSVSTDTRTLESGALFVPLSGENFEGHDFLEAAIAAGAAGVLVAADQTERLAGCPPEVAAMVVPDTLLALGDLAAATRRDWGGTVLALTGSNGKTTTKELCAEIVGATGRQVHRTAGNFNNLIGVPLTLLALRPEYEVAVVELGMNAPGEIARLTEIARPDGGAVLNVGRAHLGFLGGLDGVASAKGELFAGLGAEQVAVANADDARVMRVAGSTAARVITFGRDAESHVRLIDPVGMSGEGLRFDLDIQGERRTVRLPLLGVHQALNAAAAAALASVAGATADDVVAGLARCRPLGRRMARRTVGGLNVLDDAYNANPTSVRAALEALVALRGAGRSFAVLGEMLELGAERVSEHQAIGRAARELGLDFLVALEGAAPVYDGALAAGLGASRCCLADTPATAAEWILEHAASGDWLLVKGSRGARTERVLECLEARVAQAESPAPEEDR